MTWQRVEQGQPLGLADVKELARAGVSDEVIISQIRNSHSVYQLSTAEIIDLKDAGVSEKVIDFMINTASGYGSAPPPPPDDFVLSSGRSGAASSTAHCGGILSAARLRATCGLGGHGRGTAVDGCG